MAMTAIVASASNRGDLEEELNKRLKDVARGDVVRVGHHVAATPGQAFEVHNSVLVLVDR